MTTTRDRELSICHVTAKRKYGSRAAARTEMTRVAITYGDHGLSIYRCEACGFYHYGHERRRRRPAYRKAERIAVKEDLQYVADYATGYYRLRSSLP